MIRGAWAAGPPNTFCANHATRIRSSSSWRLGVVAEPATTARGPRALPIPPTRSLCQQLGHHFTAHVGEAEVAALETERQLFVVDAEAMQERRVEIVNVDGVFHNVVAKVVG